MKRPCCGLPFVSRMVLVVWVLSFLGSNVKGLAADEKKAAETGSATPVRAARSIVFAGLQWAVKASAPAKRLGPGPNYWSDSEDNVWVDQQGRLHLKVTKRQGNDGRPRWFCAEVISQKSFGHGEYRWYLDTPIKADPKVVLGLFTWDDDPDSARFHHREIDIELISTWGDASNTNAQFCVQPWTTRRNLHRFALPDPSLAATTHTFSWAKESVVFRALRGHVSEAEVKESVLEEWRFSGRGVPPPGGENVRMNLWLLSRPEDDASETEMVISKFEFVPPPQAAGASATVEITEVPPASLRPGPQGFGRIAGRVSGASPAEHKIVVLAKSDKWYVQPFAAAPETPIGEDGRWTTRTHGGDEYASILVVKSYEVPATLTELPKVGDKVLAVATAKPRQ